MLRVMCPVSTREEPPASAGGLLSARLKMQPPVRRAAANSVQGRSRAKKQPAPALRQKLRVRPTFLPTLCFQGSAPARRALNKNSRRCVPHVSPSEPAASVLSYPSLLSITPNPSHRPHFRPTRRAVFLPASLRRATQRGQLRRVLP
jgi:hypothetical protein